MIGAITRAVLRHRRLTWLIWLVVLVAGGWAASVLNGHLSQSFEIPGTPSAQADPAIIGLSGSGGSEPPLVPVIRLPAGASVFQSRVRADLRAGFSAAATVAGGPGRTRVVSHGTVPDRALAGRDGQVTFGYVFTPNDGNPADDRMSPTPRSVTRYWHTSRPGPRCR